MEEKLQIINLTDKAIKQLKFLLQEKSKKYVRIGIKGAGGCKGFTYAISFTNKELDINKDISFVFEDLVVFVDKKSILYIDNSTLDWRESLIHKKFVFSNPNEKSICGCGNSFDT